MLKDLDKADQTDIALAMIAIARRDGNINRDEFRRYTKQVHDDPSGYIDSLIEYGENCSEVKSDYSDELTDLLEELGIDLKAEQAMGQAKKTAQELGQEIEDPKTAPKRGKTL